MNPSSYQLIDSGSMRKLERFGPYLLNRPCSQAIWNPKHPELWAQADAVFSRDEGNRWEFRRKLPSSWEAEVQGVRFKISPTDFGHLGVFPEHGFLWTKMRSMIEPGMKILNLFAYSGGVTLAAAQQGAEVCHLDASKPMVDWARENAALNRLEGAKIRWIVDDAMKFLKREEKRGSRYEGIILDPPTFGRGTKGELFKIERDFSPLLEQCRVLLSPKKRFVIVSCHTPGYTPLLLENVMGQIFPSDHLQGGEMALASSDALPIPSGCYAIKTYA